MLAISAKAVPTLMNILKRLIEEGQAQVHQNMHPGEGRGVAEPMHEREGREDVGGGGARSGGSAQSVRHRVVSTSAQVI